MATLIVKKEIMENWTNITKIYHSKDNWILYQLRKWYYKHKNFKYEDKKLNYTVEEVEDDII